MREQRVSLGPCPVPIYPYSAFSHFPAGIDWHSVWKLVGPTVERNKDKPLWAQFCTLYLEGLNHGAGTVEEANRLPQQEMKP